MLTPFRMAVAALVSAIEMTSPEVHAAEGGSTHFESDYVTINGAWKF